MDQSRRSGEVLLDRIMLVMAIAMYTACVVLGCVFAVAGHYFGAFTMMANAITFSFHAGMALNFARLEDFYRGRSR